MGRTTTKARSPYGARLHSLYTAEFGSAAAFLRACHNAIKPSTLSEVEYGDIDMLPADLSVIAAKACKVSTDYLITGKGPKLRAPEKYSPIVLDIATMVEELGESFQASFAGMLKDMVATHRQSLVAAPKRKRETHESDTRSPVAERVRGDRP